jgi:transcription initiation factor TFIID subunit 5
MTPAKLKKLKPALELAEIDRESDDVLVRMMDDRTGETLRALRGHSGPVYSMDFSVDK